MKKLVDMSETFEVTESGASMCEKTETNRLKIGSLVMIKNFPCKDTEVASVKNGKHGAAKVVLKGKDILTSKVYECTYHGGDMVDAPIVKRTEYYLTHIDDTGALSLLDSNNEQKCDVNLPEADHLKDVAGKIKEIHAAGKRECYVTVIATLGTELVVDCKEGDTL